MIMSKVAFVIRCTAFSMWVWHNLGCLLRGWRRVENMFCKLIWNENVFVFRMGCGRVGRSYHRKCVSFVVNV